MQSNMWLKRGISCVRIMRREKEVEGMGIGLKKKDLILVLIILCVTGLTVLVRTYIGGAGANRIVIKVNGAIQGVYSLSEDQEIMINEGTNMLKISNGQADMTEADCPDQLCVNQKPVSLSHESLICLPNRVVVEVKSKEESEYDAVTN